MRPTPFMLTAAVGILCTAMGARAAGPEGDKPPTEDEKIKSLIATVRGLKDATFIRNGDEHDCKEAAGHMERKWKAARKRIKTARDFIRHAATKSSLSGEPYRIRFKDGKETTSEEFLTAELEKLEGKRDDGDADGEEEKRTPR